MSSDRTIAALYRDRWEELQGKREGVVWTFRARFGRDTNRSFYGENLLASQVAIDVRGFGEAIDRTSALRSDEMQHRFRSAVAWSVAMDFDVPAEQCERVIGGMVFEVGG